MKTILIFIIPCLLLSTPGCDSGGSGKGGSGNLTVTYQSSELMVHKRIVFSVDTDKTCSWGYKRGSDSDYYTIPKVTHKSIALYFVTIGEYDIKVTDSNGSSAEASVTITDRTVSSSEYDIQHHFTHGSAETYTFSTTIPDDLLTTIKDTTNHSISFDFRIEEPDSTCVYSGYYNYDLDEPAGYPDTNFQSLDSTEPDGITNPIANATTVKPAITLSALQTGYTIDAQVVGLSAYNAAISKYYNNDGFALVLYNGIGDFDVYY